MGLISFLPGSGDYKVWEAGLLDVPEKALRFGLANAKDFRGYLTLPAFRELCRITPEGLGLPAAKAAYVEACNKPSPWDREQWSHPAVLYAALVTGQFELRNFTERDVWPLFKLNYEKMIARVLSGEDLSLPIVAAIPEKIPQYLSPEENRAKLNKLKELLP